MKILMKDIDATSARLKSKERLEYHINEQISSCLNSISIAVNEGRFNVMILKRIPLYDAVVTELQKRGFGVRVELKEQDEFSSKKFKTFINW